MKLKNIVAALTFVVALGFTTSVYAATEVRLGTPVDANGEAKETFTYDDEIHVPVIVDTTDETWDMVGAIDISIEFNKDALWLNDVSSNLFYRKSGRTGYTLTASGSITNGNFETSNTNGVHRFIWDSTDQTRLSDSESAFDVTFYANDANGYTFNPADIKLKLNQMVATDNLSSDNNIIISADSFATYVSFEIPTDYTAAGYIHEVYLSLDGNLYQLKNCVPTDTGYKFVTSIKNTSGAKKAVAAKVVLKVADTEDAAEYTDYEYSDLGTIYVESF